MRSVDGDDDEEVEDGGGCVEVVGVDVDETAATRFLNTLATAIASSVGPDCDAGGVEDDESGV